jgi:hypothetical protein
MGGTGISKVWIGITDHTTTRTHSSSHGTYTPRCQRLNHKRHLNLPSTSKHPVSDLIGWCCCCPGCHRRLAGQVAWIVDAFTLSESCRSVSTIIIVLLILIFFFGIQKHQFPITQTNTQDVLSWRSSSKWRPSVCLCQVRQQEPCVSTYRR